ncbi:hypothetical protein Tcan_01277, partial [Toxocara canis]
RTGGVGFIVRHRSVHMIKSCDFISPRVAVLVLKLNKSRTSKVVHVYAPLQDGKLSLEEDKANIEKFYEETEDAMKFGTMYSIVQGDFNAVWCRIHPADSCVGKYGNGVRN